jgi:hypothetical protein
MGSRLADIRDTVLVAVACVVAGQLALGLPFPALTLAVIALGWLTFRRGVVASIVAALVAAVVAAALQGVAAGALLLPVLLVTGVWAPVAMRRTSPWRVFAMVTVAALAGSVGALWLTALAAGHGLLAEVAKQAADVERCSAPC